MYKCQICKTVYDLSEEHYSYISDQMKNVPVVETIISCPGCKVTRIVGGEEDYDEITERPCIMMFGRSITPEDSSKSLKEFEGIIEN